MLAEEEEKAKNLGKVKNKQEMMMVDLEGKQVNYIDKASNCNFHFTKMKKSHLTSNERLLCFTIREAEERGEDTAGAGEGQEEAGRGDVRLPGPDIGAAVPDRRT